MVTKLKIGDANLILDTDQSNWCKLELHIANQRLNLGADMLNIILQRLGYALQEIIKDPIVGSIENIDVNWVMSLSERHCSIYVGQSCNDRILFFQGSDGTLLERVSISDIERQVLYRKIKALNQDQLDQ